MPFGLVLTPIFFVVDDLQQLLAPEDTLFMVRGKWNEVTTVYLILTLMCVLLIFVGCSLPLGWGYFFTGLREYVSKHLLSFFVSVLIVILSLLYVITTSVTYVTPSAIIDCSAFRPGGTHYSYEDVTAISTGYDYYNRRTDLYYVISLKGGPDVNVVHPLIVDEEHYGEYERYEEIVEFDAALMERDIPKFVDPGNYKYDNLSARSRYSFYTIFNNT